MRPLVLFRPVTVLGSLLLSLLALPATAQLPDLIVEKSNDVGGAAVVGQTFTWSMAVKNVGDGTATTGGVMIFVDVAPTTDIAYDNLTVTPTGGASGFFTCDFNAPGTVFCSSGDGFSIPTGGSFVVSMDATATAPGTYTNPDSTCQVDLTQVITESNEGNNTCTTDAVVVSSGAAGADLSVSKNNSVSGATELAAGPFTWSLGVSNGGTAAAVFANGTTILSDNLPNSNISYGTPTLSGQAGITGTVNCSVTSSNLTCVASGEVTIAAGGGFTANLVATPQAAATFDNPRAGGACAVDPNSLVAEGDENNNGCADSVVVASSPDLTATKTNNTGGTGTVDEAFTWTVRVDNIGAGIYNQNVGLPFLVDSLPNANMNYGTPATSSSGLTGTITCEIASSTLSCTPQTAVQLASGGFFSVSFSATATTAGVFNNPRSGGVCQADATSQDLESNENNNDCSDSVSVDTGVVGPDLTVAKNNDVSGVTEIANGAFNWSLQVTNGGDQDADFTTGQTILQDNLPNADISYDAPQISGATGVTGTIDCSITTFDLTCVANGSVSLAAAGGFTVSVAATPQASGAFNNPRNGGSCSVDPGSVITEGDETNNACSNSVGVSDSPDLTITKTNDTQGVATRGQTFEWTVEVMNVGGAAFQLGFPLPLLVDSLPDQNISYGAPVVSSSGLTGTVSCDIDGTFNLICVADTAVTLAAGGTLTVRFSATPSATGAYVNPRAGGDCTVDPAAQDLEVDENNNTCSDTVNVNAGPDLTVNKSNDTSGLTEVAAGAFTWSLQVDNAGDEPATFTTGSQILLDNLPDGNLSYQQPAVGGEVGISGTGSISCSVLGSDLACVAINGSVILAADTGSFTVEVSATPSAAGTLENPRLAGACNVDGGNVVSEDNESNNSCSNTVEVEDSPDVIATKTNDVSGAITSGGTFTWSIRVENTGAAELVIPVAETILFDQLPDTDIIYGTPVVDDSSGLAGTVSCSISAASDLSCVADTPVGLAAGGFLTVTVSATPSAVGPLSNPRSGGTCAADPDDQDLETDENNNGCSDQVESAFIADGFESADTGAWN